MNKIVLTYGTFDLFHIGHLNLLKRLKCGADKLIVGVSTDEFNSRKGKHTIIPFSDRAAIVKNISCVAMVISESSWEQKISDIKKYSATHFAIGNDWEGKFDYLRDYCEVNYIPRTDNISTTQLKSTLKVLDKEHIADLKEALNKISHIIDCFS